MYTVTIQLEDEIALTLLLDRMLHQTGIPIPNMVKFSSICINRTEDKETSIMCANGMPIADEIMKKQTEYKACEAQSCATAARNYNDRAETSGRKQ